MENHRLETGNWEALAYMKLNLKTCFDMFRDVTVRCSGDHGSLRSSSVVSFDDVTLVSSHQLDSI